MNDDLVKSWMEFCEYADEAGWDRLDMIDAWSRACGQYASPDQDWTYVKVMAIRHLEDSAQFWAAPRG